MKITKRVKKVERRILMTFEEMITGVSIENFINKYGRSGKYIRDKECIRKYYYSYDNDDFKEIKEIENNKKEIIEDILDI